MLDEISGKYVLYLGVLVRQKRVPSARMVSDGGPDPAGIFSGEREARRCWITQHGHTPPSLMPVCHLIAALRTMMHCSVHAVEMQFIRLLTPLTSTQRMKDNHTVWRWRLKMFSFYIYLNVYIGYI